MTIGTNGQAGAVTEIEITDLEPRAEMTKEPGIDHIAETGIDRMTKTETTGHKVVTEMAKHNIEIRTHTRAKTIVIVVETIPHDHGAEKGITDPLAETGITDHQAETGQVTINHRLTIQTDAPLRETDLISNTFQTNIIDRLAETGIINDNTETVPILEIHRITET